MVGRHALLVSGALLAAACVPTPVPSEVPQSHGTTSDGQLLHGRALPDRGRGYVRARRGESTRYGTPTLVDALTRAAASVEEALGGAPVRIGDLSGPLGGRHRRHGSHRTGRDADIIFYLTDAMGRSDRGRGWLAFDRFGVAREEADEGDGQQRIFFFDDARNWHFVRTLLADRAARVQWIFVSNGIKARLLRYAAEHEPDPRLVLRASWVLHQPSRGNPHADHFHVRVRCAPMEREVGCRDWGPEWPWLRNGDERAGEGPSLDDDALVRALMMDAAPAAASSSPEQ